MIRPFLLATALASTVSSLCAASGEMKATGQKLSAEHGESVVWLSVIAKTSMSVDGDAPAQVKASLAGQDKESRSEALGTIVDASGLIVTSLSSVDRSSMVDGKTVNTPMGPIKLKAVSEIKEVKVIMPDGTEIPADLVMKDTDLGLGFIKIRKDSKEAQGVTFKTVDLANSATGGLLDDCIGLGRLAENLNREASVITSEISGITTKPRTFYRVMTDTTGCPVFLSTGKLLGISVVRQSGGSLDSNEMKMSPVILPAADVAKVADQAKAAQPVAAKTEETKPEEAKAAETKAE